MKKDHDIIQLKQRVESIKLSKKFGVIFGSDSTIYLSNLRDIPKDKPSDSKFIRTALSVLYENDISTLQNKTLSGRLTTAGYSQRMTPDKKQLLKELFQERIFNLNLEKDEKTKREQNFNKLVTNAITNINKSNKNE